MPKKMWVRRSNGEWHCCTSLSQTQHQARLVYVNPDAPEFDRNLKRATDQINEVLSGLMADNVDPERELAFVVVPDPTDRCEDPDTVLMLMWTLEDNVSGDDVASSILRYLPVS
jgi:hypothetical protein